MKEIIKHISFILPDSSKKELFYLFIILLFGMFFEIFGLGLLIPFLTILLDENIYKNEYLIPLIKLLNNPTRETLIFYGIFFLIIFYLIKSLYYIYSKWKLSIFITTLHSKLSSHLFNHYLSVPFKFHLKKKSGDILKNIQIELNFLIIFIESLLNIFLEIIIFVSVFIVVLYVEPIGSLLSIFILGLASFILVVIFKNKINDLGKKREKADSEISKKLLNYLISVKEIIFFGTKSFFVKSLSKEFNNKKNLTNKFNLFNNLPRSFTELFAVISISSLIIFSLLKGYSTDQILLIIGVFGLSTFRLIPSFNKLLSYYNIMIYRFPSIKVIYDELNEFDNSKLAYKVNKKSKIEFDNIEFKNVSFSYDDKSNYVIDNINFKIQKGDFVGIIGESGSGKSTLIDLFLGLLFPSKGSVNVNNINIHSNLNAWQRCIGYIPQNINLLDTSVKNNILFGSPDLEIKKINYSIKKADLSKFINANKLNFEMKIGDFGKNISGGQKQRLGIARALYNNPDILVFDESTSALDLKSENKILNTINELKGKKTIIMISHKKSILKNCNKIFEIKNRYLSQMSI